MKRILIVLVVSSILFPCCVFSARPDKLSVYSLDGEKVPFEKLVGSSERTAFLIWTTWCGYCREELDRFFQKCPFIDNMDIYLLDMGENAAAVNNYLAQKKTTDCMRSKVYLDKNLSVSNEFNIPGVPTYLFFKNGEFVDYSHYINDEVIKYIYGE